MQNYLNDALRISAYPITDKIMKIPSLKSTTLFHTIILFIPIFITACSSFNQVNEKPSSTISTVTTSDRIASDGLKNLLQGKTDMASDAFNQALKLSPDRAQYHLLNAVAYHLRGFDGDPNAYELAEEGYRLSIQFDSTAPLTHYLLGRLYLEKNKFDLARAAFSEVLLLDSQDQDAMLGLAYASYLAKDVLSAVAMIDQLEQRGVLTSAADLHTAALIKAAAGQSHEAETYYQKLQAQPNSDNMRLHTIQRRMDDWLNVHNRWPQLGKLT